MTDQQRTQRERLQFLYAVGFGVFFAILMAWGFESASDAHIKYRLEIEQ